MSDHGRASADVIVIECLQDPFVIVSAVEVQRGRGPFVSQYAWDHGDWVSTHRRAKWLPVLEPGAEAQHLVEDVVSLVFRLAHRSLVSPSLCPSAAETPGVMNSGAGGVCAS